MAAELVYAPSVVVVAADVLAPLGLPRYGQLPATLPTGRFIQIDRVGSTNPNLVTDGPRILVKVWGSLRDDPLDIEDLALEAEAVLKASAGRTYPSGKVRSFFPGGVAPNDDYDTKRPRVQVSGQLNIRAYAH